MTISEPNGSAASFLRIQDIYWSLVPPFMVQAAVKLGVFDALERGALDLPAITRLTKTSQRGMSRLADGLVGLGLLERDSDGRYALTAASATYLVSSRPEANWSRVFAGIDAEIRVAWEHLAESIRSGKPPVAHNREEISGQVFAEVVEDMVPMSWSASEALARHFKSTLEPDSVRGTPTALDVASGSGVWGIPLALAIPQLQVTAVDWEQVLEVTRRAATRHGVVERFRFLTGNLDTVDFGRDYRIAVLGHVLHAIGEARSRALLRKTFAALAPGGTIVVPEFILDEQRSGPMATVCFSLSMVVLSDDGATFTLSELTRWLHEVGFADVRLLHAPAPSPLILATKPR